MQNSIGRDAYDAMVAKIGKDEADRRVRAYGWEILPTSSTAPAENVMRAVPASEVNNLLGQGGLSTAMGGGDDMEEDDLNVANEDAADNAAADENATDAYASLGGLSAMDLTNPKQISQAILANSANQKKYYDSLANQIRQRRYGPSESEKLLALSAAFFQPTSVRGFSGTMGNVLPVLQKFGELKRDEEEKRSEALQALAKQRMALAQGDVKTALDLQRLLATYNKPTQFKSVVIEDGVGYDPITSEKIVKPSEAAWAALTASPTQENLDNFIRTFGPRFEEKAKRLVGYATGGK